MSTFLIDPGHGGAAASGKSTPIGFAPPGSPPEKDLTLLVARAIATGLGGDARLTREDDRNLSISERRAMAQAPTRAMLWAHTSPDRRGGAELWHHPQANQDSRLLAARLAEALGQVPVRSDVPMAILSPDPSRSSLAAVLLEVDHRWAADEGLRNGLAGRVAPALRQFAAGPVLAGRRYRGEADEDDARGIDGPVPEERELANAASYARPLNRTPEYARASRFAAADAANFRSRSDPRAVSRIVIHITDGRTTGGVISWFQNPAASVSSHYVVGQDGEVVQMVRHQDVAWHARGANSDSIGIEHVAVSPNTATRKGWAELPPSAIQYAESAALVAWLCDQFGIPKDRDHIVGHSEVGNTTHSDCPNSVWDWDHFMGMVVDGQSRMHGRDRTAPTAGWGAGFVRPHGVDESYGGRSRPSAPRVGRSVARPLSAIDVDLSGAGTFGEVLRRVLAHAGRRVRWNAGVDDPSYFPFSAICQLQLWDASGRGPGFGTGFYIGPEKILTCGHNFFSVLRDGTTWRTTRVLVQPGYATDRSIFDEREFTVDGRSLVHPTWRDAVDNGTDSVGWDLAVLNVPGLAAPTGEWFTLPNMCPVPQDHFVVGYGKLGNTVAEMLAEPMRCEGGPVTSEDSDLIEYAVNTEGGNSGSPVFINDGSGMIVGVHTGPSIGSPGRANRGVYLGPEKVDWIQSR